MEAKCLLLFVLFVALGVRQGSAQCETGWEARGTNCFMFMPDDHISWDAAEAACKSMRDDSNLASIHSGDDNNWIEGRMEEKTELPSLANYWIGMKYEGESGSGRFVWIDGSSKTYENWAPGEPNDIEEAEDCVEVSLEVHDQGKWNDIACSHNFGYVCKYHTESIVTTTDSTGSGAEGISMAAVWTGILLVIIPILFSMFLL